MRTQRLFSMLLSVFLIGFTGCSDDDNPLSKTTLPDTAQAFIDSRLPGYKILSIEEVDDSGKETNEKYIVTFSNDILVSFSSLGHWRRIESSSELPELVQEVLAFSGAEAVKAKYPSKTINKIHFKFYGYMVTLSDETKLAFYETSSSNKFGLDLTNTPLLWPEASRNFLLEGHYAEIARHNPYYFIRESEEGNSGYRFAANEATVFFDYDGKWYYVDDGSFSVPSEISDILPEQSKKILTEYGSATSKMITALIRNEAYYQVMLSSVYEKSSKWYMFDPQTGLEMEAPKQAVLDFLKDYIGLSYGELELQSEIITNFKQVIFHFKGNIESKIVMNICTDRYGEMLSLDFVGSKIPNLVLSYLPIKVKEYAEANYAGKDILHILNGLGGEYCVIYKDHSRIDFDKDGNVVDK